MARHRQNGAWNEPTGKCAEGLRHMSLTQKIFARELVQNQRDSGSAAGRTASFFRVVQRYRTRGCTQAACNGVPMLKKRREAILATYMDGSVLPPAALEAHGDSEAHVHLCDGAMIRHPCSATKIVYTSKDPDVQKCVVIFRGCHSHPPWPMEKPGHAAKEDVKHSLTAAGILGSTGGKLNSYAGWSYVGLHASTLVYPLSTLVYPGSRLRRRMFGYVGYTHVAQPVSTRVAVRRPMAHTTTAILRANLDVKHPAFRDTRHLRDEVSHLKTDATPGGLLSILQDYADDLKLPLAKRYVHQIRMDGALKIAVAMVPELAALLHDAGVRFLEGDITFKRDKGEMNEWEAAIWYTPTYERACLFISGHSSFANLFGTGVTITRIYTNGSSKEAFVHLFDAFFSAIKQVTGKSVRFKAFHPKGNLYSIHFDMEAAQVQGLGTWLSKMILDDLALRARFPKIHPDEAVQSVLKLCSVHFERSTDELVAVVGQKTVDYLNVFRGLLAPKDIEEWHRLVSIQDKLPVAPPGLQREPIKISKKAASIAAARETCIMENRNNHDQTRMRRNVTRTAKRHSYRTEHDDIGDSITDIQSELATATQNQKALAARLKELKITEEGSGSRTSQYFDVEMVEPPAMSPVSSPRLSALDDDNDDEIFPPGICPAGQSNLAPDPPMSSSPLSSPRRPPGNDDESEILPPPAHVEPAISFYDSAESSTKFLDMSDPALVELFNMPALTEEEMAALFSQPEFDTAGPFPLDGFNLNSSDIQEFLRIGEPAGEIPALPPIPAPSPALNFEMISSPAAPVVPGAPRSRRKRRLSVDPTNEIDRTRKRTVRVRES
ncbi:hypothetical protein C8F04DRAFT_1176777 [Mycena alexandri]|uniref:Uncharacterized protein n=1 Tax=Mycena alexandri TaxID=1745969 RepID=A0AAD6TA62_9AGAR|nr:hypothetical protein C8F04DRAFT_1176777 [Mycena alexandri]